VKGKVERPYKWLQDRIVRTCAREGVTDISDGIKVLRAEADRYNFRQVQHIARFNCQIFQPSLWSPYR